MFTGLVEEVGRVQSVKPRGDGVTLAVQARTVLESTKLGDSIAIAGVCQTVVAMNDNSFTVEAISETVQRTRLGELRTGDEVNLERAMRLSDRLGGHLVQGHVDGLLEVLGVTPLKGSWRLRLRLPPEGTAYVIEKGSIALDGVSLTIAAKGADWLETEIIPHTWEATTLHLLKTGKKVHVEWDLIAKHVHNMLAQASPEKGVTLEKLIASGFGTPRS